MSAGPGAHRLPWQQEILQGTSNCYSELAVGDEEVQVPLAKSGKLLAKNLTLREEHGRGQRDPKSAAQ